MASSNALQAQNYEDHWPVERPESGFFDGWMQVVLILFNVLITVVFILNDQFKEVKQIRSGFWRTVSIPFTAVYFVEMAIVVFTHDGSAILQHKKLYILEMICQAVAVMAYVKLYSPNGPNEMYALGASLLSFSFLLRNFRVSVLLGEVKSFKVI